MARLKNQEPIPPNHHPRRYHGVGNNHVSIRDWDRLKFSNEWIRKPLANNFKSNVILTMSRLRAAHKAAQQEKKGGERMGYVVFTTNRQGVEVYWTGEMTDKGMPSLREDVSEAQMFRNVGDAYDAADEHPQLAWFKVGFRSESKSEVAA